MSFTGPSNVRHERRRDALRPGAHRNWIRLELHPRRIGLRHAAIDVEQRDARAVDRDLDLFIKRRARSVQLPVGIACSRHREDVLAIRREGVHDRDAASRSHRRAFHSLRLRRPARGSLYVTDLGLERGSPTARRLISLAASRYESSNVADGVCTSAMLSKLALFVSSGSQSPALTSSPSRSLIDRSYSARFSRWKVRPPGLGLELAPCQAPARVWSPAESACRRPDAARQAAASSPPAA